MSSVFAAIDVGSYEIAIKIFEVSTKGKLKCLDTARRRIDLGTDSYNMGKLTPAHMDELCDTLNSFKQIMQTYKVKEYKAYATSAIRELNNSHTVLDQIKIRTGLSVDIISNSEQRFLNLKSIAAYSSHFDSMVNQGAAILDIGGGSVQVSLFEDSTLKASQNLDLGILRIRDRLRDFMVNNVHYEGFIEEIVDSELHIMRKLYLKENPVKNLIIVDDYISFLLSNISEKSQNKIISADDFLKFVDAIKIKNSEEISIFLGVSVENAELILPSAILIKHIISSTGADKIYLPGVTLADGIGFEFAQKGGLIVAEHDFVLDMLSTARNISKRYKGSKRRGNSLEMVSMAIFDCLKKSQGFSERERLLLRLSAILQDCGKYVSTKAAGESGYNIIMNTEILGLSHKERVVVANIVKASFENAWGKWDGSDELDIEQSVLVTKLSAILILGLGLARNQKKWFSDVGCSIKDKQMTISLSTTADMTLERGLFKGFVPLFKDVYGYDVVVKGSKA